MPAHTDKTYEAELKALREKLLGMGGKVESAIANSVGSVNVGSARRSLIAALARSGAAYSVRNTPL